MVLGPVITDRTDQANRALRARCGAEVGGRTPRNAFSGSGRGFYSVDTKCSGDYE